MEKASESKIVKCGTKPKMVCQPHLLSGDTLIQLLFSVVQPVHYLQLNHFVQCVNGTVTVRHCLIPKLHWYLCVQVAGPRLPNPVRENRGEKAVHKLVTGLYSVVFCQVVSSFLGTGRLCLNKTDAGMLNQTNNIFPVELYFLRNKDRLSFLSAATLGKHYCSWFLFLQETFLFLEVYRLVI